MTVLYHYTCYHAQLKLGARGQLRVPREVGNVHGARPALQGIFAELDSFTWMTDLDYPHRDALGLNSNFSHCDRTQFRYRIVAHTDATPWTAVRRSVNSTLVSVLESSPAAMPMHWWVASAPVEVELDPIVVQA